MRPRRLLALGACAAALASCGEERPEPPTPEEDAAARGRLIGSEWRLAAIEPAEGEALEPVPDAREGPRVAFAGDSPEGEEMRPAPQDADRAATEGERPVADDSDVQASDSGEGRPTTEEGGRPGEPRAAFRDPDLRRLEGHGGCNSFSGTYRVAPEGELVVRGLFATEVACMPPEVMEVESAFLSYLSDAETYRFEGDDLVISGPLGALRLSPTR